MLPRAFAGAVLAVLSVLPMFGFFPTFWVTLLNNIGLAALVAMGLVLLTGVGGMTSFGQAALAGFGGYTTALLTTKYGLSPWLSLFASLAVTGIMALMLGLLTVRLAGHYLPLGTLAWGISLYYLFGKVEALGRHDGIGGIPAPEFFGISLSGPRGMYPVIWGLVAISALATAHLLNSRMGRAIRALRMNAEMARSFGVDKARTKLIVFVYAALLAGLSGWAYAHFQRTVNPTPFGIVPGLEYLFMAVIGGAGQIGGAILGAALVVVLKDVFSRITPVLFGPDLQIEAVVFGAVILAILQFARQGLWPRLAEKLLRPPVPLRVTATAAPLEKRPQQSGATSPLLQLEGVTKKFGGLVAVNEVSFEVAQGEIVALIGPNGAGKSTTFDCVTGVQDVSFGRVRFAGQEIQNVSPNIVAAAGIGRTFQHTKLVADMSLLENVALGAHGRASVGALASILRLDRNEEQRLLAEARKQIERVGLGKEINTLAGNLALGQQRIAEIARALALDPRLLLLDEPAAGLRHFEKASLAELLRQLKAEGMTILLVEHDMGFVMGLVDRIVVLDFGSHIAEGKPEVIRTNPAVIEAYLGGVE